MSKPISYLQFPLCLIRGLHIDPERGKARVTAYSMYNKRVQAFTLETIAMNLLYTALRGGGLSEAVEEFRATGYLPDDYVEETYFHSDGEMRSELYPDVIEIIKDNSHLEQLGRLNSLLYALKKEDEAEANNIVMTYQEAAQFIQGHEKQHGPDPFPSILTDLFYDLEPDLLAFYVGLRSLMGRNGWTGTTKKAMVGRMLGCKSDKVLKEAIQEPQIRAIWELFNKSDKSLRYHSDKLLGLLLGRGLLKSKISRSRRVYISDRLSYDELTAKIKQKYSIDTHKRKEAEAKAKLQQGRLNNKG
ncbi:MAG: hypothetical protein ACOCXH_13675 [Cyclobacteriaceae bacterium]